MPNWCFNHVVFKGSREDREAFRELMGAERGAFDFEAIEPMPAELLECDLSDEAAYQIKYGDWKSEPYWGDGYATLWGEHYESREAVLQVVRHPENAGRWDSLVFLNTGEPSTQRRTFDEAADLAYANVVRFGFANWYEWACSRWGTKWNASRVQWESAADAEVVTFDTAWGPPVPILERLAERFPQADIRADWDLVEDGQRGRLVFARGELVERSSETYDPYAELKPQ